MILVPSFPLPCGGCFNVLVPPIGRFVKRVVRDSRFINFGIQFWRGNDNMLDSSETSRKSAR
jgi:hypothetical protein